MLAQQIEDHLPRSLRIPEAPAPGQGPVRLPFRISNPTPGVLWVRFRTRPFLFKVEPGVVSIQPAKEERVTVEIEPGKITREIYKTLEVVAAWTVLETDAATGKASTRNGEHRIAIECDPPRRLFACPDPECARPILSGDGRCKYCAALLQFCPTCETPALRTAAVCNSVNRHALPCSPDWPMAGGGAARSGAAARIFRPHASLAWKYAPPSPKPSTTIEWSSPAVAYNMVFIAGAVAGVWSRVVALDLATGAELWQVGLPEEDAVYPYRGGASVAHGSVYVATHGGYVVSIDAARGKRRWAARVPHKIYGGCMAAGNALFVGTVHPDDRGGHVIALWPEDGETVWSAALQGRLDTPLAAGKGRIFACSDERLIYALNAADGSVTWQRSAEGQFDGGPVLDGETLYCGSSGGELLALDADTGEPRWRETLPGAIEAPPATHSGRIYCGCADGSLYSFTTDGKKIGSAKVGAQMRAAPVPTTNGALLGAEDGWLYFSDAIRQVVPLYQTEPGTRISCPLAVSGTRVILSATNGTVYAVEIEAEE